MWFFHRHAVGRVNFSLLEVLYSIGLNLMLNVGFNSEVAEDNALYRTKKEGGLVKLI